jgi:hypothetical protein
MVCLADWLAVCVQALAGNLITICLNEQEDSDPVLRQWLAICLGRCVIIPVMLVNTAAQFGQYEKQVSHQCAILVKPEMEFLNDIFTRGF